MIPFASQRGSGQDLATHLMNEHDNELMELTHLRGSIAQDLHGAFAEWEAQASALTKCENYLYSLSVNPDPERPLTRDQVMAYIDQAEEKLGLQGQPRAVVFHIKNGREHAHAIWSRIDADKGKAVHMAYDRDKLMMVTRSFAREHGLSLPDGYGKEKDAQSQQLSLYEKVQSDETGLSKEQRTQLITKLYKESDSAKAFVAALGAHGYLLATGKRPYVLVDLYGHVNALPKMIDDKSVRTKDIRAFLGAEFAPANLPSIHEAKKLAAHHRKVIEAFETARVQSDKLEQLKARQAERREGLSKQLAALKEKQLKGLARQKEKHKAQREVQRLSYQQHRAAIAKKRRDNRPTGLAAFLGRVSGVAFVVKTMQAHQDRKRHAAFLLERQLLLDRQREEQALLARRHELQQADIARQLRGLDTLDERERRSLETSALKASRERINSRHAHMPSVSLELKPRGRKAAPDKAKGRYKSAIAKELSDSAKASKKKRKTKKRVRPLDLLKDFTRAARDSSDEGRGGKSGSGDARSFGSKNSNKNGRGGPRPGKGRDDDPGRGR